MDNSKGTLAYHDIQTMLKRVISVMHEAANDSSEEEKTNAPRLQSSGFKGLDAQIRGFEREELVFVSAKQGLGKTSIALVALVRKAKEEKVPILYYSTNKPEEIMLRLIAMESGVDIDVVRLGKYTKEEAEKISSAMEEMQSWPLYIGGLGDVATEDIKDILPNADALTTGANYDIDDVTKHCIRIKYREGIGCVIIDDFDFMDPNENISITGFNPYQKAAAYEDMLKQLKRLAIRMKCPIIVLSNYLGEDLDEKFETLRLSDLKEYGRVEKYADKVLLLSRVVDESVDDYRYRIVVARNNKGPTGSIYLNIDTKALHMNRQ